MILNDFDKIINEHFDLSDSSTRRTIVALEDSEQAQMLSALSSALYDKIVNKVDDIDFGSIPRSRGDITKVDGFDNTVECLTIMKNLVQEYRQDPTIVDNVLSAIENIKNRRALFMKAYALNIELPMVLYNLIVASIEACVSFLISVCIQYIKDPESGEFAAALDKVAYHNTLQNLLYKQVVSFNSACESGDLDTSLQAVMKGGKKLAEAAASIKEFECQDQATPFVDPSDEPITEEEPESDVEVNPYIVQPGDDIPGSPEESINGATMYEFGIGTFGSAIAIGAGAALITLKGYKFLIAVLIPLIRNITYFFVNLKVSVKDYLNIQAQFIEANAYNLQNSDRFEEDPKRMKKVVAKQLKVVNTLKRIASKISIDNKNAEKKAIKEISKEAKKVKVEDLKNDIPADIYNKSLLF